MRVRRGTSFRPVLPLAIRLECLEDRRLLSGPGAQQSLSAGSSPLLGPAAVAPTASSARADATGSDSLGDGATALEKGNDTVTSDGESALVPSQASAPVSYLVEAASAASSPLATPAGPLALLLQPAAAGAGMSGPGTSTNASGRSSGDGAPATGTPANMFSATPPGVAAGWVNAPAPGAGSSAPAAAVLAPAGRDLAGSSRMALQEQALPTCGLTSPLPVVASTPAVPGGSRAELRGGPGGAADGVSTASDSPDEVAAPPWRADLLTRFLPLDRSLLEGSIAESLARLENLGAGLTDLHGTASLMPLAAATALAAVAVELVLQRRRSRPRQLDDPAGYARDDEARFARFTGQWSLAEP